MDTVYIVQQLSYCDYCNINYTPEWINIKAYASKEDAKEFIQSKKYSITRCEFCTNNFDCDECDNIKNESRFHIDSV